LSDLLTSKDCQKKLIHQNHIAVTDIIRSVYDLLCHMLKVSGQNSVNWLMAKFVFQHFSERKNCDLSPDNMFTDTSLAYLFKTYKHLSSLPQNLTENLLG